MTKTAKHSLLFRLWVHIRGLLAIIIVLFGIVVGLVSLVLPNEDLYKQQVIDFLSKQWDKKVEIQSISGKWKGFGPQFVIDRLVIIDKDEVVVQQATLSINIIQYLIPKGSTGIKLGINDIEVDFERKLSGKIVLSDKEQDKESFSDKLEKLLASGSLSIDNLTLNLHDSISKQNNKINSKITVQQTNEKRAFAMQLDSKELADIISIKAITDKYYNFMQQAKWYIEVENLSLSALGKLINKSYLPKALVDAQVWFSTQKGNIVQLVAQAELKDKFFNIDFQENDITGRAELIYSGNKGQWNAKLNIYDIQTESISQDELAIHLSRKDSFITLQADTLNIPLLKAITQVVNISTDEFDDLLLNGKLTNVTIKYDVNLRRIIDANIDFHRLNITADIVNLTNISGTISMHDDQIRLLINSDQGAAEIPGIIRGQVKWDKLLLTAQTSMQDEDLDIKIKSLWCDCNDFILDGAARVAYDQELLLDLTVAVYHAKVNQLYKYWPSSKWKPKVLKFLDQALVSGVVDKGMIIYHGLANQYPFEDSQGVFLTHSDLIDAKVDYHQDWPNITNFNAVVDTINRTLVVKSSHGDVLDAKIIKVDAVLESFLNPFIHIDVLAGGEDNYLIEFLKQSPMKNGLNLLKQDMQLSGKQKVKVVLDIALNSPNIKVEPVGEIDFHNTDFQIGQFQLQQLNGTLAFKGFSLILEELKAIFLNQDVLVSGHILNQPNEIANIDVELKGNYDIANFESILGFDLPANGHSPWIFSISNKSTEDINFTATSDLNGVQLTMPEPFAKLDDQLTPFIVTCILPCVNSGWNLSYNNQFKTNFIHNNQTGAIQLNRLVFGNELNAVNAFGGKIDVIDVDKWISLLSNSQLGNKSQGLPFKQMTLHVKKIIFMSRELHEVDVNIDTNNDAIILHLDGSQVKGKVTIAHDLERKGIIVQLEKLHWQAVDQETIEPTLPATSNNYPPLHIWIGDFIYDGIPLGESSIEVRSVVEGIRIEKFNTRSELMSLNINGIWLRNEGEKGLSKFNIIMTSKDIAKFLSKLGFQAPISQAETIIDMQAQWSDFPSQFAIKSISGTMRIEVGKGEVVDAKPGMGRVLGLFSLTNLPRRLILDFKDVLGKGLQFQSMQGDFTLDKGEAFTKAFVIDSSSANIVLTGKTGLANQDYDQIVVVTPRVGRVLPTIGALTGGAVGAAAGFLVQGMFHKGLKDVGKIIYRVTGSWDNPIIEIVETIEKEYEK